MKTTDKTEIVFQESCLKSPLESEMESNVVHFIKFLLLYSKDPKRKYTQES